jgi:hypothetical protein
MKLSITVMVARWRGGGAIVPAMVTIVMIMMPPITALQSGCPQKQKCQYGYNRLFHGSSFLLPATYF